MAISESRKKANRKYDKKNYTYYSIKLRNESKLLLDKFCKLNGYTKNGFSVGAIFEKIERETGKTIEELQKDYEKLDDPRNIDDLDVLEEYTFKDKNINNINDIEDIEGIKNIENIEDKEDIEG